MAEFGEGNAKICPELAWGIGRPRPSLKYAVSCAHACRQMADQGSSERRHSARKDVDEANARQHPLPRERE